MNDETIVLRVQPNRLRTLFDALRLLPTLAGRALIKACDVVLGEVPYPDEYAAATRNAKARTGAAPGYPDPWPRPSWVDYWRELDSTLARLRTWDDPRKSETYKQWQDEKVWRWEGASAVYAPRVTMTDKEEDASVAAAPLGEWHTVCPQCCASITLTLEASS